MEMDFQHSNVSDAHPAPLFQRVLGQAAFVRLPSPVQALHAGGNRQRWRGEGQVTRGRHPLARLMARVTRLPPGGAMPVEVRFDRHDGRERWHRRFGMHLMASTLWQHGALLRERLGPVTFDFALDARDGRLDWTVRRLHVLGVPLPSRWFAGVLARESAEGARYRFEVDVVLPVAGLLVRYAGWLLPVDADA